MTIGIGIKYIALRFFQLFPIQKNKVVFMSFFGRRFGDNPRFISEQLEKQPDIDIVWIAEDPDSVDAKARKVSLRSLKAIYELATAGVWVDNSRKPVWLRKRKGQYYIQTWHGGVALKTIEADAEDYLSPLYLKKAKNDSKMADLFVSECEWCTENYRQAFWYDGEIMKCGSPRSDVFFSDPLTIRNRVEQYYKITAEERLILYAPTFRDNHDLSCYQFDFEKVVQTAEKRFGGKWKILIRLHPNINHLQNFINYNDTVLNGSSYNEMNDLIIASDLLITDYSSSMFDGFRIGKKVFIYASDLEYYLEKERPLYFNITDLPAPFAENEEELMDAINSFDEDEYNESASRFVQSLGYYGNGKAAEEVAGRILYEISYD